MSKTTWFEVNGDETLALDWPLNEDSVVWEIGGYQGRWAQQIWDRYHCWITIFEPQLWACKKIHDKFQNNPKIEICPYGLWVKDAILEIGNYHTDGASLVKHDGREAKQAGGFVNILRRLFVNGYRRNFTIAQSIDVCLMNIEGGEYTLIPYIFEINAQRCFSNFWCQFHPEDGNDIRHEAMYREFAFTHDILWDCYPTAVAWRRKE